LIIVAGFVNKTVIMSVRVDREIVTTIATSSVGAVDDFLHTEISGWPYSFSQNVDAVSKGGCGSVSPARTAILWNVLVAGSAGIVLAIHITPVPVRGEVSRLEVVVRKWRSNVRSTGGVAEVPVADYFVLSGIGFALCFGTSNQGQSDEECLRLDWKKTRQ